MKIWTLLILGLTCLNSWSQITESEVKQKEHYDTALNRLSQAEDLQAMVYFHFAIKVNSKSGLGKMAFKKRDSLKPIVRNRHIEKIQGVWMLTSSGSNWGHDKVTNETAINNIIIVKGNKISFFEQSRNSLEKKLIKTEIIKFCEINEQYPTFISFVYQNKQIWKYWISDSNNLRVMNLGEEVKNGRTEILCGNSELYYEKIK